MPVTQSVRSSIFTASTGQSVTLTFAVPAGKYNRAVNSFTVMSTPYSGNSGKSGFQLDGARHPQNIGFNYTITSPNSSTSGTMTLPFDVDAIAGQNPPYSFGFGDAQNGVTLPNILLLPDDFYKDLITGCTVTLSLTLGYCASEAGQAGYHLFNSVVLGSFGYLPTTASLNPYPGTPFTCTDKPSEQALHFTGALGIAMLPNRGAQYTATYPPYTFEWSDGSGKDPGQGQTGEIQAKFESQQDVPDSSGDFVATSVAVYHVTRDDPGINEYGYGNYTSDYPWSGTVTITDSDFVPNVVTAGIGDTPGRDCTMGGTITIGPPSADFAKYDKPAYTAQATGGFVEPVTFLWAPRYRNQYGQLQDGEYGYFGDSIVTAADSQTIIFASFNPPPPAVGNAGLVDVACKLTDSDHFRPCSHLASAAAVLIYTPPAPTTTQIPRRSCISQPGSRYCRAEDNPGGGISFRRANGPVPKLLGGSLWEAISSVTAKMTDSGPALVLDSRGLLYCAYARVTPPATPPATPADTSKDGVYLKRSDDYGTTWGARLDGQGTTEIMAIPGGTLPAIASGGGSILAAAITGSDKSGYKIQTCYKTSGNLIFSAPVIALDSMQTPLAVQNSGIDICRAAEPVDTDRADEGRDGDQRVVVHRRRGKLDADPDQLMRIPTS